MSSVSSASEDKASLPSNENIETSTLSTNSNNTEEKTDEELTDSLSSLNINEEEKVSDDQILYLHINVDGLTSRTRNLNKLTRMVQEDFNNEIDVLCVSEPNKPNIDIKIPGYRRFLNATTGPKGGAAIYVKSPSNKFGNVHEITLGDEFQVCDHGCAHCSQVLRHEAVWIQFTRIRDNEKIVVGAIYRHPDKKVDRIKCFVEKLDAALTNALNHPAVKAKYFYLLGDFNIDLLKQNERSFLLDRLERHDSIPLNTTISTTTTDTLIDHIHTNDRENSIEVGVSHQISFGIHYPTYCRI